MREFVDRRVLAGFRCVDAITGSSVFSLSVSNTALTIRATQSGVFAVLDGPGLRPLTAEFDPDLASWPAPATYEVTIQDPGRRYLPRRANIAAPQPLPTAVPPASAGTTTTTTTTTTSTTIAPAPPQTPPITTPQEVLLYRVTAAPLSPNWAVIRVLVAKTATPPLPLPWAVIQVTGSGIPAVSGLTNQNGEALLAVPGLGLKLSTSSTGAVTENTTAAVVTAYYDPSILDQPEGWLPNPDDILLNLSTVAAKSAPQPVELAPGQPVQVALTISM
jgi:hypothetical protein